MKRYTTVRIPTGEMVESDHPNGPWTKVPTSTTDREMAAVVVLRELVHFLDNPLDNRTETYGAMVQNARAILASTHAPQPAAADKFKTFVHKRLDEAGVPHDPDADHNQKTGCRIGGRLNWLIKRSERMREALECVVADFDAEVSGHEPNCDGIEKARAALTQPKEQ